jgi:hypothetical protein
VTGAAWHPDDLDLDGLAAAGGLVSELFRRGIVERQHPRFEVETKLAIGSVGGPEELLASFAVAGHRFAVDAVTDGRTAVEPVYTVIGGTEYSYFDYRGSPLVKVKEHQVAHHRGQPVMVSTEDFLEGAAAVAWRAEMADSDLIGPLSKQRAKVFLVERAAGFVFSAAVTVCTWSGREQRQFELEYHASPSSMPPMSLHDLGDTTVAATQALMQQADVPVAPTTETKLQFLKGAIHAAG